MRRRFRLASLASPPRRRAVDRDAAWLAGRWVGEGLGGKVEETWAPAAGGQMVGHFQLVKAGKPVFYEIMLLDAGRAGSARVKHFNPDFTAWEDKAVWHSFEPVASSRPAEFKGLALGAGDRLTVTITSAARTGSRDDC